MFYYIIKDNKIIKYEIKLNIVELEKLRFEIINNCSLITHKHYKTTRCPYQFDYEHVRNYHEKFIGVIEYNDFYSSPEDEYLVDYDYYEHPELVSLIDALLKSDASAIEKIKNTKDIIVDIENPLLQKQQRIIEKLHQSANKDISKQLDLLNENQKKIIECKKQKELNKSQVSVQNYIEKVLNCIKYKEVATMDLEIVSKVQNFLYDITSKSINDELNKVLKLEKGKHN